MVSRILRMGLLMLFALGALLTAEADAQTGAVRGTVIDDEGQPVPDAQVQISYLGGVTREFKAETNEEGSFIRVGLQPGEYRMTFSKDGHQPMQMELRIRIGDPTNIGEIVLPKISEEMQRAMEMRELNEEIADEFKAGIAAAEAEDYRSAIAAFEKVLEIHPESAEAYFNKGFAHSELGETEEAEASFRKAIELDPTSAEAYIELSNIHADRSEWAQAQQMLERAVEFRPDDVRYQFNLGAVATNAGDLARAEAAFRKVLELDPTFAMAHYQLGMVNVNKGSNEEAIAEFEKYIELEPEGAHVATAQGIIDHLKQQPQSN